MTPLYDEKTLTQMRFIGLEKRLMEAEDRLTFIEKATAMDLEADIIKANEQTRVSLASLASEVVAIKRHLNEINAPKTSWWNLFWK